MRPRFVKLDFEAAYDDYFILATVSPIQTLVCEDRCGALDRQRHEVGLPADATKRSYSLFRVVFLQISGACRLADRTRPAVASLWSQATLLFTISSTGCENVVKL